MDARGVLQLDWGAGATAFGRRLPIAYNDAANEISARQKALSAKDCARVVQLGDARPPVAAGLERGNAVEYRTSTIAWIEPDADAQWLYHRIAVLFQEANRRYGFELQGLVEALQYTVYGPGDKFDWHADLGPGTTSGRKLSMSILLSPDEDYDGGHLEFLDGGTRSGVQAGTAVFFPSYMAHRVAPITRGVRRSLVAWAYGPTFR